MGFRDRLKGGGGFLNNVDGIITAFPFSNKAPGSATKGGWVYGVLTVRKDGAQKDDTQHLFMGSVDEYEISKDGLSVSAKEGGVTKIGLNTPIGKFITSLLDSDESGELEKRLPDDEPSFSMQGIVGTRVRFVQQPLTEKELAALKKKGKATVRTDKNDPSKTYPLTETIVETVYELPTASNKTNGAAKSGAKGAAGARSKAPTVSSTELADRAIADICADAGVDDEGDPVAIPKQKLTMRTLQKFATPAYKSQFDNAARDATAKTIQTEEYLTDATERGVILYNAESKTVSALPA